VLKALLNSNQATNRSQRGLELQTNKIKPCLHEWTVCHSVRRCKQAVKRKQLELTVNTLCIDVDREVATNSADSQRLHTNRERENAHMAKHRPHY